MPNPIDSTQAAARLVSLLQRTFAARSSEPSRATTASSAPGSVGASSVAGASSWAIGDLLRSRAQSISRDHPDRRRVAGRLLIEVLLSQEFGTHLATDPAYQGLIDDVLDSLQQNAELASHLDRVVAHIVDG